LPQGMVSHSSSLLSQVLPLPSSSILVKSTGPASNSSSTNPGSPPLDLVIAFFHGNGYSGTILQSRQLPPATHPVIRYCFAILEEIYGYQLPGLVGPVKLQLCVAMLRLDIKSLQRLHLFDDWHAATPYNWSGYSTSSLKP